MITPSKYQKDIFNWIKEGEGNLYVEAVAGSGKTTTIVEATKKILPIETILFLAFNKHIATELSSRVSGTVKTTHAFGFSTLGRRKVKANKIIEIIGGDDWKKNAKFFNPIGKTISLAKANLIGRNELLSYMPLLEEEHDIEYPKGSEEVLLETWDKMEKDTFFIDFDDMIYLPIKEERVVPHYDWVLVDEAQDLNPCQMELIKRINGRTIFVGDTRQAIYGFRGASPEALRELEDMFNCSKLPLSVCYRCGSEIVNKAKEIVPQIEYHWEGGTVSNVKEPSYVDGDYILCRVTAPLIKECLNLISEGQLAKVVGREIGKDLLNIIKKIRTTDDEFLFDLGSWEQTKIKSTTNESKRIAITDKADSLRALFNGSIEDMIRKIEDIFSDKESKGVTLSTIHRAKGLEGDRVYILEPGLLPHPLAKQEWQKKQEDNLHYVAITRAKKELIYVK